MEQKSREQKKDERKERELFDAAKNRVMNVGKFKGATYDEIARSAEGLSYLVWISSRDWFSDASKYQDNADRHEDLMIFLSHPDVCQAIREIEADKGNRQ